MTRSFQAILFAASETAILEDRLMIDESFRVDYYRELQESLRRLLATVRDRLPVDDVAMIGELIDANECGLALETLSDAVAEERIRIDQTTLGEIARLGGVMGLGPGLADRLRTQRLRR